MKIVINAGHTKFGKGTGAVGKLIESVETRKIAFELMKILADTEHEIICAVFDRSEDNLKNAVDLSLDADLFVSIHLNASGGQGTEVYTYKARQTKRATAVVSNLSSLGFKNRGVKDGSSLYVIRKTKCEAMLIEVCFVDSQIDFDLFRSLGYTKIAKAIANGILKF